jgi:hypothetical protein
MDGVSRMRSVSLDNAKLIYSPEEWASSSMEGAEACFVHQEGVGTIGSIVQVILLFSHSC